MLFCHDTDWLHVVVQTSKGGVLIPEAAQSKVPQGVVVAVGEGARNEVKEVAALLSD